VTDACDILCLRRNPELRQLSTVPSVARAAVVQVGDRAIDASSPLRPPQTGEVTRGLESGTRTGAGGTLATGSVPKYGFALCCNTSPVTLSTFLPSFSYFHPVTGGRQSRSRKSLRNDTEWQLRHVRYNAIAFSHFRLKQFIIRNNPRMTDRSRIVYATASNRQSCRSSNTAAPYRVLMQHAMDFLSLAD
jgi:hypothetical protein